jgi:hypothetical protein
VPLPETLQLRRETDARLRDAEKFWKYLWGEYMDAEDLDRSFANWIPWATTQAGIQGADFAKEARSYLTSLGLDVSGPPTIDAGKFTTSMHVLGVGAVKAAIARGEPIERAMAIGRSLTFGAYSRTLMDAQREQIMSSAIKDRNTPGWRRIGAGGCDFCKMLIERGAVYSQRTAFFASHDRCRCSAEPALDDSTPWIALPRPATQVPGEKLAVENAELTQAQVEELWRKWQDERFADMVRYVRESEMEWDENGSLVKISPREALRHYVSEGDLSYEAVNSYLRQGSAGFGPEGPSYRRSLRTLVEGMDQLFRESAVTSPSDQWVTRGVSHSMASLMEGHVVADPSFLSTTVDPAVSKGYGAGPYGWKLRIKIPRGVRYVQGHTEEGEIILNRGTKLRVLGVDSDKKTVQMEVL